MTQQVDQEGGHGKTENKVPLGVAKDDRPPKTPKRAATNDAEDRRRALIIIGMLVGTVLLLVVLGNTLLRPAIVGQRERMAIGVTQRQVAELAELSLRSYEEKGIVPSGFASLEDTERLETSDGRDLWGNPFAFVTDQTIDGKSVIRVRSAGPDGEFETDDDITAERILPDEKSEL